MVSSDPAFKALLIDGRTVSGRLVSLGPGAIKLMSTDGTAHELPLNRLIKLTRDFSAARSALDASHVILPDGDRIMRVSIESSTETSLEIQSDVLGKLLVPLDGAPGIDLRRPELRPTELDPLWEQVRAEPRTTEVVWLANGDRLAGGFLGLDESKIKIQVAVSPSKSIAGGRRPRFRPEADQLSHGPSPISSSSRSRMARGWVSPRPGSTMVPSWRRRASGPPSSFP